MGEEDVCAICLSEKEHPSRVTKGRAMCECQHEFCQRCVVAFVRNKNIENIECPICRAPCIEQNANRYLFNRLINRREQTIRAIWESNSNTGVTNTLITGTVP